MIVIVNMNGQWLNGGKRKKERKRGALQRETFVDQYFQESHFINA